MNSDETCGAHDFRRWTLTLVYNSLSLSTVSHDVDFCFYVSAFKELTLTSVYLAGRELTVDVQVLRDGLRVDVSSGKPWTRYVAERKQTFTSFPTVDFDIFLINQVSLYIYFLTSTRETRKTLQYRELYTRVYRQ